jgi:predicted enzyme related to lactoylglutathione lyase
MADAPCILGDLCYFVLPVGDADRAQRFFGGLLGWRFEPGNVPGGYQIEGVSPPGGLHGGGEGSGPELYFVVDDLDSAIARVRELGGGAEEPQPTTGGRFARCRDDQGMRFGIWAPNSG